MGLWRVKIQKYKTCYATKDSDYDKITEFTNENKANHYYLSEFNDNYKTILEQQVNGKWEYKASSCCSEFINS